MVKKAFGKIMKGVRTPSKIIPYLKKQARAMSYYYGDASWAMNPLVIKLYVNSNCNAKCIMCDVGQRNRESVFSQQVEGKERALLSIDDCRRLIQEVKSYNPQIHIHGLEPLLNNNILDLISTMKQEKLYVFLITNGILLAPKARDLIELGVDLIAVSIDGPKPVHDQIRGSGVYDKAIEGVRLLRYWRGELQRKHIRIATNFTISDWNYHCLEEYADTMLVDEQVDFINLLHLSFVSEQASHQHNHQYGSLGKSSPVNIKVIDPAGINTDVLWSRIEDVKKKYPADRVFFKPDFASKMEMDLFLKKPDQLVFQKKCKVPWKSATIVANGDVIINNRCFEYKAGNIHVQPFGEIWGGERYRTFRRELKRKGSFPACYRCCGRYYGW